MEVMGMTETMTETVDMLHMPAQAGRTTRAGSGTGHRGLAEPHPQTVGDRGRELPREALTGTRRPSTTSETRTVLGPRLCKETKSHVKRDECYAQLKCQMLIIHKFKKVGLRSG